jgi:hypothetical protein
VDRLIKTALESKTGWTPPSICACLLFLSIEPKLTTDQVVHIVFKGLFQRKPVPLTGAPPVRRLKTYSAQSGYVYQYSYEGYRTLTGSESGVEFVFSISPDRKTWHLTSVLVSDASLTGWEQAHERQLSSTERYATAKMALFQAFDERAMPDQMKEAIRLREADVDAIIEMLGL